MPGPYYVDENAAGGGDTGADWANAFLTFGQAVTAATTANDIIYVAHNHAESLAADTTYTFGANVNVFCVNTGTGALATTALIGNQAGNYSINLTGAYKVYIYGVEFKLPGTNADSLSFGTTLDGMHYELESCKLTITNTRNNADTAISLGAINNAATNSYIRLVECVLKFGGAAQRINVNGTVDLYECSVDSAGTAVTTLFSLSNGVSRLFAHGCDFSHITGTLVKDPAGVGGPVIAMFVNCKLGLNVTMLGAPTSVVNKSAIDVYAFNCALDNDDASQDEHFHLYHGDAFGETYVTEDVYCNTGAAYDGTNRVSWQIITRASNCSYYTPYTSPWIDVYHSGTSAITPYLEILRSGSTTKYQDDEVWSEWSYQGTSGSTKATIVNDRMTPLGTAADQTASSLGASDWTGEDATNNAYMKLESGSITPAEIGHIRARAVVGEPNITVYVDPYIRGLT